VNGVGLVASTSPSSPLGFSVYRKVGAFYTNASSNIFKAYYFGEINRTTLSAKVSSAGVVSGESLDFINGNFTGTSPYTGTFNPIFTLAPNCVATYADSANVYFARINSVTSSSVTIGVTGTVSSIAGPFNLICEKQGVDAIQPDWSL